jgi:hypothetical protein
MGLLDLFKQLTGRKYLPKVSVDHVVAPYEESGTNASYSHKSGYIVLPISYVEETSGGNGAGYYKVPVAQPDGSTRIECSYQSARPASATAGPFASSQACQAGATSVAIVRLHRPVTTKTLAYSNQRHGLLPKVHEPDPNQSYLRTQDSSVVLGIERNVSAPEFGAMESHGAAWGVNGSTSLVYTTEEPIAGKVNEKVPRNSYDGTEDASVPKLSDYERSTLL